MRRTFVRPHNEPGDLVGGVKREVRRAANEGFDLVVMLKDADGRGGQKRAAMRHGAQEAATTSAFVAGVAIESHEAWLLADCAVLVRLLSLEKPPPDEPAPESLSAKRGHGRHPKSILEALLAKSALAMSATAHRSAIAGEIDLDVLTRKCPKGFAPFRKELEAGGEHA